MIKLTIKLKIKITIISLFLLRVIKTILTIIFAIKISENTRDLTIQPGSHICSRLNRVKSIIYDFQVEF